MPRVKKNRRKAKQPRRRRRQRKHNNLGVKQIKNERIVCHIPKSLSQPWPSAFKTTMNMSYMCYTAAGVNTNASPTLITANSMYKPFNSTVTSSGATIASVTTGMPSTADLTYSSGDCPSGISIIYGTSKMYQSYTVLSATLEAQAIPQDLADNVSIVLRPVSMNPYTNNTGNYANADGAMFSKQGMFNTAQMRKPVRSYMTTAALFGVSQFEVLTNPWYSGGVIDLGTTPTIGLGVTQAPFYLWGWEFWFNVSSPTASASPIMYRFRYKADVIFYNIYENASKAAPS